MPTAAANLPNGIVAEVALWCSRQKLTAIHQDSPDEARRRELLEEAQRLFASARYPKYSWLSPFLPSARRWTRAMKLLTAADPNSLAPMENQLRSSSLQPADSIGSYDCSEESKQDMVYRLIQHRSALVKAWPTLEHDIHPVQFRGRLLRYDPWENVQDGSSRFASKGFFDDYDCPPWDTWLQYKDRTLISWVPQILVPLAQAGIDANPMDCINWAD